jgi:glycolate oxidase FAD binding subunit
MMDMPNVAPGAVAAGRPVSADRDVPTTPTSTADVRDAVRFAVDRRTPIRLVGRGTWLGAGRPVSAVTVLRLDGLAGIVDYTPGDLTLTARAGTSLAAIAMATAAEGQWLPLAPWGGDDGSLGATVATASAGPFSGSLGTPRDIVIGVETVTGAGDVIRGGGRVVKNVAGFDLTRLMVGAWGTLGVLTEVSVRLRALPECDATLALSTPPNAAALADMLTKLRAAPIIPLAIELLSAGTARHLALGDAPLLLVRVAGNAELVAAQRDTLGTFAAMREVSGDNWARLRTVEPDPATVLRLSGSTAQFAEVWASAERIAASVPGALAHGSVSRSVVRVILPQTNGELPDNALAVLRAEARQTRIVERLPASLWSSLAPTAVSDRLSRGVRAAFDPHRILNPGMLGELDP